MAKGKIKPSLQANKTKDYKKRFKEWEKNGYQPIIDTNGDSISVEKDERFIPLVYPCKKVSEFKPDYGLYVSNYGKIVSFKIGNEVKLLKQKLNNEKNGRLCFDRGGKYVHRAVWYSFAYEAVSKKKEIPLYFKKGERITSLKDLKNIIREEAKRKTRRKALYEVHHTDTNRFNNRIDNLELVQSTYHTPYLHAINNAKDKKEKWEIYTSVDVPAVTDGNGKAMAQVVLESENKILGVHAPSEDIIKNNPMIQYIIETLRNVFIYIDSKIIEGYFVIERKVGIYVEGKIMGFYVTEGKGNPIKQIIDELPFEEYDVYYGDIFVEKNKVKKGILIKNTSMLIG